MNIIFLSFLNRRITVFIGFLILFFSSFFNPVHSETSIDLTEICNPKCKGRVWYAIDSFDPAFLNISEPDKNWKKIEKFPVRMNELFSKDGNLATYSLMTYFDISDEILNHPEQAGIRFGEIGEVFEIYINGKLIAKEGETDIKNEKVTFHRTVRGKVWQVPKDYIQTKDNHLLVKLMGHPKFDHTGFYLTKNYDFGLYDSLKYNEQDRVTLALITVYLVVGLYHLFLFYRRRIELYNFYYGSFAFIVGIYIYTRTSAIFEHNWDTTLIQKVEFLVLYLGLLFLIESLDVLFFNKVTTLSKVYRYFLYVISFLTFLCPEMYMAEYILRLWQLSFLTFGLPLLGRIFYLAIKQGVNNAKRLLTGLTIFILAAIFDIVDSLVLNTGLTFSKYAFFMYIVGFAGVLANRFILIHNEIEDLNENLEQKVENRTKELSNSFDEIKLLKDQQDGDYFLTSLLLHPLGANQAKSEEIKVEFLLKQKKQFKFKKWESEIGGDICRSRTITLKNRPMTIFLNADAMGKSMQGAGGALVLGAVFNSIIERTILSQTVQNQYPEKWLKSSFIEMHKVFESFDGSMLVSLVMGILDNKSGLLYFINAEHPSTVLYRDGEASFIGEDKVYRKLGSSIVNDSIYVQTFQMREGDVIINGSDGRDDIQIGMIDKGRIINEDEMLFLRLVKKGNGKLKEIAELLQQMGEQTDDLSLLRIEFNNSNIPIQEFEAQELPEIEINFEKIGDDTKEKLDLQLNEYYNESIKNLRLLKYLIVAYIRIKQYSTAIPLALEYIDLIPSDTDILYYLSFAYRKDRNFQESIEHGERVRLRNPTHIKNLINLVQSYASSGNLSRADEILESASTLEPENEKIQSLEIQLEKLFKNSMDKS